MSAQKTPPAKLAVAVVAMLGAVGFVGFNLGLLDGFLGDADESVALASDDFATEDSFADEESEAWAEDEFVDEDFGDGDLEDADDVTDEATPAVISAPTSAPDWSQMFSQLMEREEERAAMLASLDTTPEAAAVEAAAEAERLRAETAAAEEKRLARLAAMTSAQRAMDEVSRFELRGVMSEGGRGVALVNSHLVREGEVVPGTRALVVEIHRDRLVVEHPDVDQSLAVHLAPLDISTATESDTPDAPEEVVPAIDIPEPVVSADDG